MTVIIVATKCTHCPVPDPLVCTATRREMAGHDLCGRLNEPGFVELLLRHATPPCDPCDAADPDADADQTIARVESMAARANAGERGGGCGPCP